MAALKHIVPARAICIKYIGIAICTPI